MFCIYNDEQHCHATIYRHRFRVYLVRICQAARQACELLAEWVTESAYIMIVFEWITW